MFPGGVVDALDASPAARAVSSWRADQSDELLAFVTAAVRESFEELGVLLARPARASVDLGSVLGSLPRDADERFFERISEAGLRLALDEVHWLSRWITDRDMPKRFDARFFVARMPEGQRPVADEAEQFEPTWVLPAQALERHERGEFSMIFPTVRTLRALSRFGDVGALLHHCRDKPGAWVSCPRAGTLRGEVERFSEEDLPFGELELVAPDGRILHELE